MFWHFVGEDEVVTPTKVPLRLEDAVANELDSVPLPRLSRQLQRSASAGRRGRIPRLAGRRCGQNVQQTQMGSCSQQQMKFRREATGCDEW